MEEQCVELGHLVVNTELNKFHQNLNKCCSKLTSAIKYIDHFFHDILDYNLLSKDSKNFEKDKKEFDIKNEVEEIQTILKDQAQLKNIKIRTCFKYFFDGTSIKSDPKRLK